MRWLHLLFGLLFFFGALVQYNDPDPLRWMAIYLLAAVACLLAVLRKLKWWFAALIALVALGWAATLAPSVFPNVRAAEMVAAWEMKNSRIEEGREMYGLLMIGVWMTVLAVTLRAKLLRRPIAY